MFYLMKEIEINLLLLGRLLGRFLRRRLFGGGFLRGLRFGSWLFGGGFGSGLLSGLLRGLGLLGGGLFGGLFRAGLGLLGGGFLRGRLLGGLGQLETAGSAGSLGLDESLLLHHRLQSLLDEGRKFDDVNLVVGSDVFLDGDGGGTFAVSQSLDGGDDHSRGRGVGRLGLGFGGGLLGRALGGGNGGGSRHLV